MSATAPGAAPPSPARNWLPASTDLVVLGLVAASFLVLFLPTYAQLARTIWASDEQGHGPIILGASAWLLYQRREALAALPAAARRWPGWVVLGLGMLCFAFGHSQAIVIVEVGSQIVVLAGLLLLFKGRAALRLCWFPLFFLIFMVPLPSALVDAVTLPMKMAVSYVAEHILYWAGYPIARKGVILHIGQYQLLVADACAGLHTLFTLEALGLLYLNIVRHPSWVRNVLLAILIVPIAFSANVIRVMVLTLVTYHFGDEAGQGFIHGFAGVVLFLSALVLVMATDSALRWIARRWEARRSAAS